MSDLGDIALRWADAHVDLALEDDDLASDAGLRTAVLLSLFTDRRAEEDDALPAGDDDRRGWWADEFAAVDGDLFGSRLWLLDRSARRSDVVLRAEEFVREALAWMLEDRVVEEIGVEVETTANGLVFAVTLQRPDDSDPMSFRFAHAWEAEA